MKAPTSPNAKKIYRPFLVATVASLSGIIALIAIGEGARTGPLFVALLGSFAIYVRGNETLKGFAFTIWIFAGVAASMFYPFLFRHWGTYKLTQLIEPLMMIIM
jgi:BASS family bile acid:Na+ symporter